MNIGLPGAGIGGLYYLCCTAIMPVKELFLTLTKPEHKFRYRHIAMQLGISIGIIAGFFLVYQLIDKCLGFNALPTVEAGEEEVLFYSLLPIIVSLSLLMVILVIVEFAALFVKNKKSLVEKE